MRSLGEITATNPRLAFGPAHTRIPQVSPQTLNTNTTCGRRGLDGNFRVTIFGALHLLRWCRVERPSAGGCVDRVRSRSAE
jgi:hypothetical protein